MRIIGKHSDDSLSSRTKNTRSFIWQAAVSALLLIYFVAPKSAEAFLKEKLLAAAASLSSYLNQTEELNSQNMPVLEVSYSTQNATGGADIKIADSTTLLPNISPAENSNISEYKSPTDKIKIYVVQKGDTLSGIAKKFGVTVNTIRWANDLGKDGLIKVGQELVILPIDGVKYKVKRGGTLRDIIKIVGGDIEEAAAFNGIDPDEELAAGTEVIIPHAKLKEPKEKSRKIRSYVKNYGSGQVVLKGYFMRPVKGGVKTQGLHGKNAVDIAASYGTAIYAAAPGRVIISKWGAWNGGYGNYIVIQHPNGTQTLYAHLAKNLVRKGDYVQRGQIIGTMGSTGRSTGVHVHFEIRGAHNPF